MKTDVLKLGTLSVILAMYLSSCATTKYPETRLEQKVLKEEHDAKYNPPTEREYDGDIQIGGG